MYIWNKQKHSKTIHTNTYQWKYYRFFLMLLLLSTDSFFLNTYVKYSAMCIYVCSPCWIKFESIVTFPHENSFSYGVKQYKAKNKDGKNCTCTLYIVHSTYWAWLFVMVIMVCIKVQFCVITQRKRKKICMIYTTIHSVWI